MESLFHQLGQGLKLQGCGGGQVVSAFISDDLSSNPADVYNRIFSKIVVEKNQDNQRWPI